LAAPEAAAVGGGDADEEFENEPTLDSNDDVDEDRGKWGNALKEAVGVRMDGCLVLLLATWADDIADDEVPKLA